jgi:hypothetical protein
MENIVSADPYELSDAELAALDAVAEKVPGGVESEYYVLYYRRGEPLVSGPYQVGRGQMNGIAGSMYGAVIVERPKTTTYGPFRVA